jgi:4-amino-4-deoxy-L-arabinose transferase-like glycosyltransferase
LRILGARLIEILPSRKLILPMLPILVLFLWASFYGLDFGIHWDEDRAKFDSVRKTLRNGVFLQGAGDPDGYHYNYGGLNYMLTWAGLTPEILHFLWNDRFDLGYFSNALSPAVDSLHVRLRVRRIYLILSTLAIIWLYALCLVLGRSRLEASLAASLLAASWEFAYHSRWIAPDGVMMQFSLLCFLTMAIGLKHRNVRWFYVAAISSGLAMGSKYTGGLVLPFVIGIAAYMQRQEGIAPRQILRQSARLFGIAVVVFFITSPAMVMDPFRFWNEIRDESIIYATGWYGYTVIPGLPHLALILKYFFLQFFSSYAAISFVLATFCVIGFLQLAKERRLIVWAAIVFVLAYIGYFSGQSVLIVRNLLVVVPFLCLAAARGIMTLAEQPRWRLQWPLIAFLGISLAMNFGWQIYAAIQVKKRYHPEVFVKQFAEYVTRNPSTGIFISAKLANTLQEHGYSLPSNLVRDPERPHTKVAFLQSEGPNIFWKIWPSNYLGLYEQTFGPQEVNLDVYSTFIANQRIILTTPERFKVLPIGIPQMLTP